MPKRKYEDYNEVEGKQAGVLNQALRSQREQFQVILEQSKKSLVRALKLARGFERQKLGRRQKVAKAKQEDADTARMDAEVAALKVCKSCYVITILRLSWEYRSSICICWRSCISTNQCSSRSP